MRPKLPPVHSGAGPKLKLMDQLREALRSRHYSRRTEQSYCHWVKRLIYFHKDHRGGFYADPHNTP